MKVATISPTAISENTSGMMILGVDSWDLALLLLALVAASFLRSISVFANFSFGYSVEAGMLGLFALNQLGKIALKKGGR